ncbi:MAG: hypothetical protein ACOYK6_03515 [Chthoniobacterales bacterium]
MKKISPLIIRTLLLLSFCMALQTSLLWSQSTTPPAPDESMILVHKNPFAFYTKSSRGDAASNNLMVWYNVDYGTLAEDYYISSSSIKVAEYCACLNAVIPEKDPHGLYKNMESLIEKREITPNRFLYLPRLDANGKDLGELPMTLISRCQAFRYCNWKENKSCDFDGANHFFLTRGIEVTEIGSYKIEMRDGLEIVTAAVDSLYHLPSPDEFIAAAFQGAITHSNNFEWTELEPTDSEKSILLLSYLEDRDRDSSDTSQKAQTFKDRKRLPVIDLKYTTPSNQSGENGESFSFHLVKRIVPAIDPAT